jgi:hypothetical protein
MLSKMITNLKDLKLRLTVTQPDKMDVAWVRRLALNFEKRISKNAELRAKFENDPQKCVTLLNIRLSFLHDTLTGCLQVHGL